MEAPRLAPTMSSPGSPCEEVLKNLSLEAIQLCERDGKAAPRGPLSAAAPPPARTKGTGRAGQHRGQHRAAGPRGAAERSAPGADRGEKPGLPAGREPPVACRYPTVPILSSECLLGKNNFSF